MNAPVTPVDPLQAPSMRRFLRPRFVVALVLGAAFGFGATVGRAAEPTAIPKPPYYSLQLGIAHTRAEALQQLKAHAGEPFARAEQRRSGWQIRAGAWTQRADADSALKHLGKNARTARVLTMETNVPWLLPDGTVIGLTPAPASAPPGPAPAAPLAAAPAPAPARAPAKAEVEANQDFTELSLQELLNVQVTSVSKHAEPLRQAAAAIFVLSGDEIRRSGARTIAEALRLVPGLQVYQTNAQSYTVTSRGFSGDKLEVLLDGRSAYTPLSSTVFWDALDTYMPDIDRIEVIRGPGATLWGANAVNGVINIVTRSAKDTVGTQVGAAGGKEESATGGFRTGSKIGDSGYARLYAKAFERDASVQSNGSRTFDGQRQGEAGFRSDWTPAKAQDLTVSGDFYRGSEPAKSLTANARGADTDLTGANVLAHWARHPSADSEVSVQVYYDGYHRVIPQLFDEKRDTGDLQVQHRFAFGESNTVVYGAGYRASRDNTGGPPLAIIFDPQSRTLQTYNVFAQDQLRLGEGGELTVGSKFEHDSYTGFSVQPGVRLGWALGDHAYTWGAVSRAVRLPNRIDEDIAIFCSAGIAPLLGCTVGTNFRIGNSEFKSEKLIAYEWGARLWTDRNLSVDLATFYNDYTDLKSTETMPPPIGSFANNMAGKGYGGELSVGWAPLSWMSVRPFYGFLKLDLRPVDGSTDAFTAPNTEGASPQQTAGLRVGVAPGYGLNVDSFLRYVDGLPRQKVPGYTELNLRVAWRPVPSIELALTGANLLDGSHPEAGTAPSPTNPNPPPPATEVERAAWLGVTWDWK